MNRKTLKCCNCGQKIKKDSIYYRGDDDNIYCRTCFDECVVDEFLAEHEFCNDSDDDK